MNENGSPRERHEREERLHDLATSSSDERATQRVFAQEKDPFRTEFHRDYTRIIHSRAFRRLRHKTQVFISPKNDHLCTRLEHSLHVASVAQTIARALRLNEDLVRAIAVGHDLGHAPFGHTGQTSLDAIAKQHGLSFAHELQSLRVVDFVERAYARHPGLNLTFAVRDGIVCHCGEGFEQELCPDRQKDPQALNETIPGKARPATLEGCVVRWADKIAYLGRDLDDAIDSIGLLGRDEIPSIVRETLGTTNRQIISRLVGELVCNATHADALYVSDEVHRALNKLYNFNMSRIYRTESATQSDEQIDRAMRSMFDFLLDALERADGDISAFRGRKASCLGVFADFLEEDVQQWQRESRPQLVLDFIAGMTDSFFIDSFLELFLPRGVV